MEINGELLQKIINTVDFGIVFVDANKELVVFNRAAGVLLNLDPAERIGTSVLLCHPKELEQGVAKRMNDIRNSPLRRTNGRTINYQGRYIHETFYATYDDKGDYMGTVGVFVDVADKVSLMKQIGNFDEPREFGVGNGAPRRTRTNTQ